jgi:hypothetical protein
MKASPIAPAANAFNLPRLIPSDLGLCLLQAKRPAFGLRKVSEASRFASRKVSEASRFASGGVSEASRFAFFDPEESQAR